MFAIAIYPAARRTEARIGRLFYIRLIWLVKNLVCGVELTLCISKEVKIHFFEFMLLENFFGRWVGLATATATYCRDTYDKLCEIVTEMLENL